MCAIDRNSLGSARPRTTDGREYPEHLRAYEQYDGLLLPLLEEMAPATFDQLSMRIAEAQLRAALPRWLSSAEWRGIAERADTTATTPRAYVVGPAAHPTHRAA